MANPFVHVELNTVDVDKAKSFYGQLFDWKLEDILLRGGGCTMIKVGDGTGERDCPFAQDRTPQRLGDRHSGTRSFCKVQPLQLLTR
jgi:catechol 2,3-dioxygenase-like lactoylglutathione lyase family enzyme